MRELLAFMDVSEGRSISEVVSMMGVKSKSSVSETIYVHSWPGD